MLRLCKAFVRTDNRLLSWALWLLLTVSTVLIYGFAVGGMISVVCLCILWCAVSAVDILLSVLSKKSDTVVRKTAYALLKGFGAVLLAIILYTMMNRLSPTLITTYTTRAEELHYSRNSEITVLFSDPNGQQQSGEMPDFGCVDFSEEDDLQVGDPITVAEYEGIFGLTYRLVTRIDEDHE